MPNRIKRFQEGGETEEDRRLQDVEDRVMGRSRSYKRGERMARLLDPSQDPITGRRDLAEFAKQKIANIFPGIPLKGKEKTYYGENPLYNLLQEANRISKAYHGQDYVKDLQNLVGQAGWRNLSKDVPYEPKDLKLVEEEYKKGGKVTRGDGIAQRGKTRGRYL